MVVVNTTLKKMKTRNRTNIHEPHYDHKHSEDQIPEEAWLSAPTVEMP